MSVENELTIKLKALKNAVGGKENVDKAMAAAALEFAKDTKENRTVPFRDGYLSDSPFRNSASFAKGEVKWTVPYAAKMHETGGVTGVPNWDTVTWNENESDYERIVVEYLEREANDVL